MRYKRCIYVNVPIVGAIIVKLSAGALVPWCPGACGLNGNILRRVSEDVRVRGCAAGAYLLRLTAVRRAAGDCTVTFIDVPVLMST